MVVWSKVNDDCIAILYVVVMLRNIAELYVQRLRKIVIRNTMWTEVKLYCLNMTAWTGCGIYTTCHSLHIFLKLHETIIILV